MMYPNGANSSSLQGSSAALHTAKNVQPALRRIGKTLYHPPAARLPRPDVSRATLPILTVSYASELNRNVIVKLADILTSSAALPDPVKVRILPLPQRPKAEAFFIFEDSGERYTDRIRFCLESCLVSSFTPHHPPLLLFKRCLVYRDKRHQYSTLPSSSICSAQPARFSAPRNKHSWPAAVP